MRPTLYLLVSKHTGQIFAVVVQFADNVTVVHWHADELKGTRCQTAVFNSFEDAAPSLTNEEHGIYLEEVTGTDLAMWKKFPEYYDHLPVTVPPVGEV